MVDYLAVFSGPFPLPPFSVFGREFTAHALLVAVGIVVGTVVAFRRARTLGLSPGVMAYLPPLAVIPGFIGSHLLSVFAYHPEAFVERPLQVLEIWSGMSSLGGFVGTAIGVGWFFRRNRDLPFLPYVDALTYGFTFAWIFGRLGCTVSFDHPGVVTDFFMGMEFPGRGEVGPGIRHNLGFYELLWTVVMAAYFYGQRKRPKFKGWYLSTWVIAFVAFRFPLDFLRAADVRYAGLTPAQWIMPVLFALCVRVAVEGSRRGDLLVPDGVPKPETYPGGKVTEAAAMD